MVADEVRKLAEKSADSAGRIEVITHQLEAQSEEVDQAIQSGLQALAASQDYLEHVATVLAEATQTVTDASGGVEDIAGWVIGQKSHTDGIAANVEHIARSAEDNCATAAAAAEAARGLRDRSAELRELVGRFTI